MEKDFSFFITAPPEPAPTVNDSGDKEWRYEGKLHRENAPAVEAQDGTKEYYRYGKRHRSGGPAIERANGDKEWYCEGMRHRDNGPAVQCADGSTKWFLKDLELTELQITQQMTFLAKKPPSKPKPPKFTP